jgi:hypothetical protein
MTSLFAGEVAASAGDSDQASLQAPATDSAKLEKELQSLNWGQFRSVVEAVPKLKADVDAYGPLGWEYVKMHYTSYGWKKNIDRLDVEQKQHLAALIESAKAAR